MDKYPKISVLIAVYNAEKYLRQCLDSLAGQTLEDCQFICINDCSTDSSADILQEYARRDNRFQVLCTPVNSGIAKARNLGLQFAKGKYITTLDADDWFAADSLEQACQTLTSSGVDCVLFQLIMHQDEDGQESVYPIISEKTQWSGEEAFKLNLEGAIHGVYVIGADYYRRFPFDDASPLYSDENTTNLHFLHASTVTICEGRYYYRQHLASMTHACSIRRFDRMVANLSMKQQLEALPISDKQDVLAFYETHRWFNVVGCYWYYYLHKKAFTPDEHREIANLFRRMLPTIEQQRLPAKQKWKLGYYPFKNYQVFCWVENFYFSVREIWWRFRGKAPVKP